MGKRNSRYIRAERRERERISLSENIYKCIAYSRNPVCMVYSISLLGSHQELLLTSESWHRALLGKVLLLFELLN